MKTLIIAIGNGGCNVADSLRAQLPETFEFVLFNPVDAKASCTLLSSDDAEIEKLFTPDVKRVIVVVCLGGFTGSHYAPHVVSKAVEAGVPVTCIATMPFAFEGKKREERANDALAELRKWSNDVLVLRNDEFFEKYPDLTIVGAFKKIDIEVGDSIKRYA